jgi:hypothetical protein
MDMDENQRRKRQEQRQQVLEDYRSSGLTQKAFCESRELPLSTLQYWLYADRSAVRRTSESLVPVGVTGVQRSNRAIRIRSGGRLVVEVDLPVDREQLDTILQAVTGL